ncbi:TIM-barrel domain-containing protein (plasmid) [Croceibacterium sp. TMG7-5b_MA50]|uniref:TIM-barrel domain-containing protein n=1 Tax=Croceibacterium sp. TMG7-5b_MA50 TaxID=3121290 RepID=UPI003221CD7C
MLRTLTMTAVALCLAGPALASEVARLPHGVLVTPDAGPAKAVRVLVYGDGQFRVTAMPAGDTRVPDSLMVIADPVEDFTFAQTGDAVTLSTATGTAEVRLADGHVRVLDAAGAELLSESPRTPFQPVTIQGRTFQQISQQFNRGTDEGFYGLGQHQNRQMNYNGEDVELAQHNMDIAVPFVVSTKGYGLLWDNESITRFGDPRPPQLIGADATDALKVTSNGQPGWQAEYYLGDTLAVRQVEPVINYQYLRDQARWPEAAKATTVASGESGQNTQGVATQSQRVVWTGTLQPEADGVHKLRLYSSSYVRVFADGKEVLNRWRQNWNPWYHNFDLPLSAGKPVELRIEWEPNQGYIALFGSDPLADEDRHSLWLSSEAAEAIDYYVVTGQDMDGVIAGYRDLTGKAALMPKWAYGFWQSRQRYDTQDQLLDVVREYRRRRIPLDNIVLDWRYWTDPTWGSHEFDATRFPDPVKMVEEVHQLDGRIMISVWPKFYPTTKNGQELDAAGFLYRRPLEAGQKDWVGPGYANTYYNPYTKPARDMYFRQIKEALVDKGFDAWWMDAVEPDWHSNLSVEERKYQMGPTARGPGAFVFNSYPLIHAEGMADGLRDAQPDRRPFILTRSGFGGIQRTSSALWSGDVAARWDDLRDQISAGVNISLSGIPNWTHDIGGFAVEDRYTRAEPEHLPEWRELNLRWFQFGAWTPLFRSHGETPYREVYELGKDDPAMYRAMVGLIEQRYRLLPYIYSVAADTYWQDGTIMRGLPMDFAADREVWGVDDQYMFGPAFLVAPVTERGATSRQVRLPAGADWYDWRSGAFHRGGQAITAPAAREEIPVYVRAGAIVPTGPAMQHSAEQPDGPIVLHVFTGADGAFTWQEDDGTTHGYQQGQRSAVPISWNDAAGTLTIGARQGSWPGMAGQRAISVRFHQPDRAVAPDFSENGEHSLTYDGTAVTVRR